MRATVTRLRQYYYYYYYYYWYRMGRRENRNKVMISATPKTHSFIVITECQILYLAWFLIDSTIHNKCIETVLLPEEFCYFISSTNSTRSGAGYFHTLIKKFSMEKSD